MFVPLIFAWLMFAVYSEPATAMGPRAVAPEPPAVDPEPPPEVEDAAGAPEGDGRGPAPPAALTSRPVQRTTCHAV